MRSISFEEATAVGGGMIGAGPGNYLWAAEDDDHELTVYGDPWTGGDEAQYQAELEAARWCGPAATLFGAAATVLAGGTCVLVSATATLGASTPACAAVGTIAGALTGATVYNVCTSNLPRR
jgi:hypothetical protein